MKLIWLAGIVLLACSCSATRLGPQKPPEYFLTPSVTFVAEATGKFEDKVKQTVIPALRTAGDVERAYLVKIEYPDGKVGTCLCLTPGSAESMKTAEAIGVAYGVVAEQGVFLDIMFVDDESLESLAAVAEAFYVRP